MPVSQLQGEMLKVIRGKRTSSAMSARLGYRYNQYGRWESGERRLLWTDFVAICEVRRLPLREQVELYLGFSEDLSNTSALVKTLLDGQPIGTAANETGLSRFKISRYCLGKGEPTFLEIYALLRRGVNSLSFLEPLVDLAKIPSLAADYKSFQSQRELTYTFPYLDALLEALVVQAYLDLPQHDSKVLARASGLPVQVVDRSLAALVASGMLEKRKGKYAVVEIGVDYRADKRRMSKILAHWLRETTEVAEKAESAVEGSLLGFSVLSLSEKAHEEASNLLREFLRGIHKIGSEDRQPKERVLVFTTSLVDAKRFGEQNPAD